MGEALTISTFAKRSGVPSKTIRYWEGLGLLPKAARSHTGYRLFDSTALRYVAFIQKSKAIGLTLGEMQEVLHLARRGRCPCPEVFGWTQAKAQSVAEQIRVLSALLLRLKRIRREWKRCSREKCGEVCSLIAGLPECKFTGGYHAKGQKECCDQDCCGRRSVLPAVSAGLPAVPALLPGRLTGPAGRGPSKKNRRIRL